jgi:hypothetical protein
MTGLVDTDHPAKFTVQHIFSTQSSALQINERKIPGASSTRLRQSCTESRMTTLTAYTFQILDVWRINRRKILRCSASTPGTLLTGTAHSRVVDGAKRIESGFNHLQYFRTNSCLGSLRTA